MLERSREKGQGMKEEGGGSEARLINEALVGS